MQVPADAEIKNTKDEKFNVESVKFHVSKTSEGWSASWGVDVLPQINRPLDAVVRSERFIVNLRLSSFS